MVADAVESLMLGNGEFKGQVKVESKKVESKKVESKISSISSSRRSLLSERSIKDGSADSIREMLSI